jgi:FAD/FMN-containing dehydrogenase/Fe-S oxidoreductase
LQTGLSSHAKPIEVFERADQLARALARTVRGEVRFDRGSRALYATDASNYRQVPIGLVIPRDAEDVIATLAACRQFEAPVLPRGAGTSLAGQCCNVAVVLDFTKYMNQVLEVNPAAGFARVQPGVVLDTLRRQTEPHGLTFGPDPSTHSRCTLGGMIGNNSCGTHSLLAGKTVDNIDELRIVLYDGTELTVGATSDSELAAIVAAGGRRGDIYRRLRDIRDRYADLVRARFPNIPRRVSGYNLDQLLPENGFHVARALVGSEGTCVTVVEARARLISSPPHRALVGLGYADAYAAADHVPEILALGPIGLEGFEGAMIDGLRRRGAPNLELMPAGRGYLLVEFGGESPDECAQLAETLIARIKRWPDAPDIRRYSTSEAQAVWKIRESGPRAASNAPGQPARWEGWDDAAVAPAQLGAYLRDLRRLLDEYDYQAAYYGHFGHGCIHMQVSFDLQSADGVRRYGEFVDRAADLVVSYGGSLSGEHGDGQSRGALLPKMFGPELMQAFREFKGVWDPANRMNPHKLVDAYLPTENLRLGEDYKPIELKTRFAFAADGGSLARASLRCIGIGECRKQDAGTMCPSYMATLEEAHSTRGRAHLLFEVLQGEALTGNWKNDELKAALDLCLSCKACKTECPTNVDIATYRAEFLSHYYEERRRPLHAYAFGLIDRWARFGSIAPNVSNWIVNAPAVGSLVKRALQVTPQRTLPRLAPASFRASALRQRIRTVTASTAWDADRDVVLWVDTFNNYFQPQTSHAAVTVLADAGLSVSIAREPLCCGRPLYDFGMLDHARTYLRRVLDVLGPAIDAGVKLVVLEPSCASVFRDELAGLFPGDPRAERLSRQTLLFSELLMRQAPMYAVPELPSPVLLHGHCHHKALMKMTDEDALLRRMGADVRMPDAGCCGMAGAFGFGKDTFAVSQAIGERILLPAVRAASPETLIVADGFSCREQILHGTGRRALHVADAMAWALEQRGTRSRHAKPVS